MRSEKVIDVTKGNQVSLILIFGFFPSSSLSVDFTLDCFIGDNVCYTGL